MISKPIDGDNTAFIVFVYQPWMASLTNLWDRLRNCFDCSKMAVENEIESSKHQINNVVELGSSSSSNSDESSLDDQNGVKDPRIRARPYQLKLKLCKKAMEENVIVFLGTSCGKTHIVVLLIYELGHLIRKPEKSVCVFLAPTIPLVKQVNKDDLIQDMLVLPSGSDLHDHPLVKNGSVFLQGKASSIVAAASVF